MVVLWFTFVAIGRSRTFQESGSHSMSFLFACLRESDVRVLSKEVQRTGHQASRGKILPLEVLQVQRYVKNLYLIVRLPD